MRRYPIRTSQKSMLHYRILIRVRLLIQALFHGTKADLQVGDLLTARGESNYKSGLKMNHIYFTALVNWCGTCCLIGKR